jgi:hypothetical protein
MIMAIDAIRSFCFLHQNSLKQCHSAIFLLAIFRIPLASRPFLNRVAGVLFSMTETF